jgi:hypothetical protein
MAWTKTHDLAVKTGEYQKDGKAKARYLNVGMVMRKDDGGEIILLNRTFNPAGVPVEDGKDSIVISKFEVKDEQREPSAHNRAKADGYQAARDAQAPLDDEIPF